MIQLWLSGKRIDSVALLRNFIAGLDAETQKEVCVELVRKYQSGQLPLWLSRQSESRPCSRLEMAKYCAESEPGGASNVHLGELAKDPSRRQTELTQEELALYLAEMCAVSPAVFKALDEDGYMRNDNRQREKAQCVAEQDWYQSSEQTRFFFAAIDWNHVALDSQDLAGIVGQLAAGPNGGMRQPTVYLCDTGSTFTVPNPGAYRNLRLVGYGNPLVRFGAANRGRTLDLQANRLDFEGFRLSAQGMGLANADGHLAKVEEV